jgi:hypothetical protein
MPPMTKVGNVVVFGKTHFHEDVETDKGIVLNGRRFTKADINDMLSRISALETRVTALGG